MKKHQCIMASYHCNSVVRQSAERLQVFFLWFVGLSGSGRSTFAYRVKESLHYLICRALVLIR